jgi:hypothetical protein
MAGQRQTDFTPRNIAAPEKHGGLPRCMKPGSDGALSLRDQARQISLSTSNPATAWQMLLSWASQQPDRNEAMHPVLFQMLRHADKPGFAAIAPQVVHEASRCSMHAEARENLARMLGNACTAHGLVFNPASFSLTAHAAQSPGQPATLSHPLSHAGNAPAQPVQAQSQDSGFFTILLDALSKMKEQVRDLTTLERATLMEGNDLRRDVATEQMQAALPNAIIANTPNYAQEPLMQMPLSLQEVNPPLPPPPVLKRCVAANPHPADGGPAHPHMPPGPADGLQRYHEMPARRHPVINSVQPRPLPALRIKAIHQVPAPSGPVESKIKYPTAIIPVRSDQMPKVPKLPGVPEALTPLHAKKPAKEPTKEPALPVAKTRQLPAKTRLAHAKPSQASGKRAHPHAVHAKSRRHVRMRLQPGSAKVKTGLQADARKETVPKRPSYQAKVQNLRQEAPERSAPAAERDSASRKKARERVVLLLLGNGRRNQRRKQSKRQRK